MFLLGEQIKAEAQRIIEDDVDNDILLIAAHKGVGKSKLLEDIYGSTAFNKNIIVASGKTVKVNVSNLRRCFAEGIIEYVSRHNNSAVRGQLNKLINLSWKVGFKSLVSGKIPKDIYGTKLCRLSINELKKVYYDLAKDLPLVIVSSSMVLTEEEISYLSNLDNDPLGEIGARITFVVGIRATPQSISAISKIINNRNAGVWVMPLMPVIDKKANETDLYSMASISINDRCDDSSVKMITQDLLKDYLNNDTYEVIRQFLDNGLSPQKIHILANQEITRGSYDYLLDITKDIYKIKPSQYEKGIVLPYNNKLLWLDVLSYYFAMQKGLDTVIQETQKFYFLLINEIVNSPDKICREKITRNSFISFIHEAESAESNNIANGFAKYYADFAKLAELLFSRISYNRRSHEDDLIAIEVLERVSIDFSTENIAALQEIYDETQICAVLDIGIEALATYIGKLSGIVMIPNEIMISIKAFIRICIKEMYKWNDLTLMEHLLNFLELSSSRKVQCVSYADFVIDAEDNSFAELVGNIIKDKICKGAIIVNAVEQNLVNFWANKGGKVVEEYKGKLYPPLGIALPDSMLEEKLSQSEFMVLTANPVESAIITRNFMNSCAVKMPEKITADSQTYQFFNFNGHRIVHVIPQRTSGFSEFGSADAVRGMLSHITSNGKSNLKAIFSIGVAYGMNPKSLENEDAQEIGDVLVSDRIVRWDAFSKFTESMISFNNRDAIYVSEEILGGCRHYLGLNDFPINSKEPNIGQFHWFLGTILSGNVVLSDMEIKQKLEDAAERLGIEDVIGGEMEGSGIWFETKKTKIPMMIIKGICDWGANKNGWDFVTKNKKEKDLIKDCIQAYASENAFKTFSFIIDQVYGLTVSYTDIDKNEGENNSYKKKLSESESQSDFWERITLCMEIINSAVKPQNKLNVESLGRIMGVESSQEIIQYMNCSRVPSYEEERIIAEKLGINPLWLQEGNGIYQDIIEPTCKINDIKIKIMELSPETVWLVYDQKNKEISFIFQHNEYSFRYVNYRLPFMTSVGADHQSELIDFYKFLIWINQNKECPQTKISNELHVIDYDLRYAIKYEKMHPAKALTEALRIYYTFIDDFLDYNCDKYRKELYERKYGKEFTDLQNLITRKLNGQ